ncbi:hypothetical protein TNCV_2326981 [Trichonephila clavipes]|nr:hypothetical protein TNCV_2326981 [Trichonephila clavipes]
MRTDVSSSQRSARNELEITRRWAYGGFQLHHADDSGRICRQQNKSMNTISIVTTLQADGGSIMVWMMYPWRCIFLIRVEERPNAQGYLSVIADQEHPISVGLSSSFLLMCSNCKMQKKLNSCELIGAKKNIPEINRRSVLTMRCIGQGLSGLSTFCSIMPLPKPVSQKAYDSINIRIADECETLENASMSDAALEEKFLMEHVTALLSVGMAHGKLVDIHHLLVCDVNWSRVWEGARYRDYVILL